LVLALETDAKHAYATDKCGSKADRGVAEMIAKAVWKKKNGDKRGSHFVPGWRLHPNKDHPRWTSKDVRSSGVNPGAVFDEWP
jgi:hypothetical protein